MLCLGSIKGVNISSAATNYLNYCVYFPVEKIKILQDMINEATKLLESNNAIDLVNNSPEAIQQLNGNCI